MKKLIVSLVLLSTLGTLPAYGFNNQTGKFVAASAQYLNITDANQTGLDLTNFTFTAWIKLASQPPVNHYQIITKRATNNQQYRFYYSVSECVGACLTLTTGDADCLTESVASQKVVTLTNNRWYHLAWTHGDPANEIYIDGVAQVANVASTAISNCTGAFEIGSTNGGIQNFDGLIDEVSAWSRILSPDEIRGLMKKQLTGKETGLVGYWPMEGDFKDRSNNTNNLTNNNSATNVFDRAFWDSVMPKI